MQFVHGQHIGRGERRGARTPFIIQRRVQRVSFSRAMLLSLGCSYSSVCVCVCVCVHQSETASLSRDNEILREELRQLRPGDVDRSEAIPASTLIDIINQRARLSMKVTAIDCSRFAGPIVCGLPPTCNLFLEQDIVLDSVCQVDLFDSIDERDKEHTIRATHNSISGLFHIHANSSPSLMNNALSTIVGHYIFFCKEGSAARVVCRVIEAGSPPPLLRRQ